MDDLAESAGVSRSTIHRIENALDIRPQAARMAAVLRAVDVTEEEAATLLPPAEPGDAWRDNVLRLMSDEGFAENGVRRFLRVRSTPRPSLVAVRGEAVALIELRGDDDGAAIEELGALLDRAGFIVTRPV